MPGFGAERQFARGQSVEKKLKTMTIRTPEAEGEDYVVEHEHHPPHGKETFRFAPNENGELAKHLATHLRGLKFPGKVAPGESAEPEVSKSDFE